LAGMRYMWRGTHEAEANNMKECEVWYEGLSKVCQRNIEGRCDESDCAFLKTQREIYGRIKIEAA